jgi:hypothetical protein
MVTIYLESLSFPAPPDDFPVTYGQEYLIPINTIRSAKRKGIVGICIVAYVQAHGKSSGGGGGGSSSSNPTSALQH